MTVSTEDLRSETIVRLRPGADNSEETERVSLVLNGKPDVVTDRIKNVINIVQKLARENESSLDLNYICD